MQYRSKGFAPAAAAAALILTACGDDKAEETAAGNLVAPLEGIDSPDAVILYPAGTAASLETNSMRAEVDRLEREQRGAGGQGAAEPGVGQGSGGTAAQAKGGGAAGAGDEETSFAGLDRDSDKRLSPAEYAIYNLPRETPARQDATHDDNPPFVSDEALNRSAMDFRKLDSNGDFFLSPEEFQRGAR